MWYTRLRKLEKGRERMFIQVKDLDQSIEPKNANVFVIQTYPGEVLYISRSFIGYDFTKYTHPDFNNAIVFFNRQHAELALNTEFKFVKQDWKIVPLAINKDEKKRAQQADAVKRMAKNERRRKEKEEREAQESGE